MTRSLGGLTPLKTTFGGSLVPSAVTAKATVKLCFSALQVFTGTVQLPVNLWECDEGSWKYICVLSMLMMQDKGYLTPCLNGCLNKVVKLHKFLFNVCVLLDY